MNPYLASFLSALAAAALVWLILRGRAAAGAERLRQAEQDLRRARVELDEREAALRKVSAEAAGLAATLEAERRGTAEKLTLVERAAGEMKDAFRALSADALTSNSRQFLELAATALQRYQAEAKGDMEGRHKAIEHLVAPIRESLEKVNGEVRDLEKSRREDFGKIREQVASLIVTNRGLQSTTDNLVKALRRPHVRGQWGEIQLRKVVELAGMVSWCDFAEQATLATDEGRLRPDLVVRLPGGKNIVVDAKAPLQAYLDAVETTDEAAARSFLADHARHIRDHMAKLGARAYWDQFQDTPEFVVMFLPGEAFFSAALEQDPGLIEQGVAQRVILANPTTLIALLKAVAYGWRQERLAENAAEISRYGKELYERLAVLAGHLSKTGAGLDRAVEAYNAAVASLETRVLVSARRFNELGCGSPKEIPDVPQVERQARAIQSPELRGVEEGNGGPERSTGS